MTWRIPAARAVLPLAAVALTLGPAAVAAQVVERVVDGDTIIVADVGRVRLIGVDTPESVDPRRPVQFFGKEASAFANAEIIRQGYGHAYTRFPFRYSDRFRQYEREARDARRGLWAATTAERRASSALPPEAARYDDDGVICE